MRKKKRSRKRSSGENVLLEKNMSIINEEK